MIKPTAKCEQCHNKFYPIDITQCGECSTSVCLLCSRHKSCCDTPRYYIPMDRLHADQVLVVCIPHYEDPEAMRQHYLNRATARLLRYQLRQRKEDRESNRISA